MPLELLNICTCWVKVIKQVGKRTFDFKVRQLMQTQTQTTMSLQNALVVCRIVGEQLYGVALLE